MELNQGWITEARQVISPHCDLRPEDEVPSLLIIHNISLPPGKFGGPYIDQLFTGTLDPSEDPFFEQIYQLRVAAHCLIRRTGEVVQYVPFDQRAWHAGGSAATTSLSASSLKEPTLSHLPTCNIRVYLTLLI
jgi:AmpD protein